MRIILRDMLLYFHISLSVVIESGRWLIVLTKLSTITFNINTVNLACDN